MGFKSIFKYFVDKDPLLAANSDMRVPTQKAIKTYADSLAITVAGGVVVKGGIDCSSNPNFPAADKGHLYFITVSGKIGGASGDEVEPMDTIICTVDGSVAGTKAAVGANWIIVNRNIVYTWNGLDKTISDAKDITTWNNKNLVFVDVKRTDSYTEDGSIAKPYKTISAAMAGPVASAASGVNPCTLFLMPGIYPENVIGKSYVNITSADRGNSIVMPISGIAYKMDDVSAYANIEKVQFMSSDSSPAIQIKNAAYMQIRNLYCQSSGGKGIQIQNASLVQIENVAAYSASLDDGCSIEDTASAYITNSYFGTADGSSFDIDAAAGTTLKIGGLFLENKRKRILGTFSYYTSANTRTFSLKIDGGGFPVVAGLKTPFESIPFEIENILGWNIRLTDKDGVDVSDTCTVDLFYSSTYNGVLASMTGAGTKPNVSATAANSGSTMTGWTTSLARGGKISPSVTVAPNPLGSASIIMVDLICVVD